ncbi:hypothetical protein C408_2976 [Vibrio diabolicus E0666]|nr:hypothetical protein C408_2976 [Vibrio diabolicus E0666]
MPVGQHKNEVSCPIWNRKKSLMFLLSYLQVMKIISNLLKNTSDD